MEKDLEIDSFIENIEGLENGVVKEEFLPSRVRGCGFRYVKCEVIEKGYVGFLEEN